MHTINPCPFCRYDHGAGPCELDQPARVTAPSPEDELATLIRDALTAASHAGYESARYVHDATPAAVRNEATDAAQRTALAMWRAFYEHVGVPTEVRERIVSALAGA